MIINNLEEIPRHGGIYKLQNKINNKIYIGKTNNLYKRIRNYPSERRNRPIINALIKYGFGNFEIEILHWFENLPDISILLALETAFIIEYNSLAENNGGYNICLIGNDTTGIYPSKITRKKMSENNARKGIPILPQTSLAVSRSNKNRDNSNVLFPNRKGKNNSRFDHKIYQFKHLFSGEIFWGYKMDFYKRYGLRCGDACAIIKNPNKGLRGWTVTNQ